MSTPDPSEPPGDEACTRVLAELPTRLRTLAPLYLTGFSQKEMAQHTGLSYHTVRSYSKEIYAHFKVSSREELAVKLRPYQ